MAMNIDGFGFDEDFTGYGWTYGVGINAAVTEHLNVRLSYDVTSGDLDADHNYLNVKDIDTDIKQLAIGVHYQF